MTDSIQGFFKATVVATLAAALASCGGGGDSAPAALDKPVLSISLTQQRPGSLHFSWPSVKGASYYMLTEDNGDGTGANWTVYDDMADAISIAGTSLDWEPRQLFRHIGSRFLLRACVGDLAGCSRSDLVGVTDELLSQTVTSLQASNKEAQDQFGSAMAVSTDGNTLAVGAPGEDDANNTKADSGAVYVFVRDSRSQWTQQAYIKKSVSTNSAGDHFGMSLALSRDDHQRNWC